MLRVHKRSEVNLSFLHHLVQFILLVVVVEYQKEIANGCKGQVLHMLGERCSGVNMAVPGGSRA